MMADISEPKQYSGLVVECHDCAFAYIADHELDGGGYDCPNCNEIELGAENKRLRNVIKEIEYVEMDQPESCFTLARPPTQLYCPYCFFKPGDGHVYDCIIGKALEGGDTDER